MYHSEVFTLSFICHKARALEKTGSPSMATLYKQSFISHHQSASCQEKKKKEILTRVYGPYANAQLTWISCWVKFLWLFFFLL